MKLVITDSEPLVHRNRGYECAAWWKEMKANPGEYEISAQNNPCDFRLQPMRSAKVLATITADHFPSLFGGSAFGDSYDVAQNRGQADSFIFSGDALSLLRNSRVVLTEDEYDVLLQEAIKLAVFHESHHRKRVVEEFLPMPLMSNDSYQVVSAHDVDAWHKTLTLLSELTHNRTHRKQSRERLSKGWPPLSDDMPRIKQELVK